MSILSNQEICLLNEDQIADTLGVSVATIRRWRLYGKGPKFIKVGAAVRYERGDFESWLLSRPTGGEHATEGNRG